MRFAGGMSASSVQGDELGEWRAERDSFSWSGLLDGDETDWGCTETLRAGAGSAAFAHEHPRRSGES